LSDEHYFTFFCCSGSYYCLHRFDPLCDEQQGRRSFALIFALDLCRLFLSDRSFPCRSAAYGRRKGRDLLKYRRRRRMVATESQLPLKNKMPLRTCAAAFLRALRLAGLRRG
jgi:hypothetical protein